MSFEEDDFSMMYEYIDWTTNTEGAVIDGKEKTCLRTEFGLLRTILIAVEAMVREIEFDKDSVGFDIKTNPRGKVSVTPKAKTETYYRCLSTFWRNYAHAVRRVYSPHVQAAGEALDAVGLQSYAFRFGEPGAREPGMGKTHAEIFNEVVAKVAEIVASSAFKERVRVRKRNAARNEAKGLAIEQKVFENKSRQLVLMLHFGYQREHRSAMTFDEIQKHRKKFFNNCRTNKLLRGIVDYIWKLEEGDESGLHLHVLIFYTADSCRDVYIARQLGEYWNDIATEGKGQYWNSNAHKAFHEKYGHGVGTGEINWDDDAKREALRENIRYMTKADQFLKMKYGEHSRLFGTSQVEEKKKPGRPRTAKLKGDPAGSAKADSFDSESIEETGAGATNRVADQSE
ncbi:inovirus-type Gp2 protein [Burkholderia vietnamiensis]|uniref:inovirus-type Gp2 protein n=1 Tax=Burkholderia vietnamiensis TaxID=60552 RepID=UPI001BA11FBB|nr:inovirus-type Gp2 protein [Burkholderia vietnamiensis]MBR8215490.1 inovirus-type Gp2 protein [Burkholderia vietnamiensis]HDV8349164.1 inovirus-type Gp2 protein [Burkholderia vietnamiensis]